MSLWPLVARTLYETARVATRTAVEVCDEGGLAAVSAPSPCIVVANHCSHGDTPVLLYALPSERRNHVRFIGSAGRFGQAPADAGSVRRAEQWLMNRLATRGYRAVLVGHDVSGRGAIDAMVELLSAGETVVLYPEGTRSRTGMLGPLRQGIAHLMHATDAPVVPVRIDGTHTVLPPGSRMCAMHGVVTVRFRSPIERIAGEDAERLLARVAAALAPPAAEATP